jgi:hypothetical protein
MLKCVIYWYTVHLHLIVLCSFQCGNGIQMMSSANSCRSTPRQKDFKFPLIPVWYNLLYNNSVFKFNIMDLIRNGAWSNKQTYKRDTVGFSFANIPRYLLQFYMACNMLPCRVWRKRKENHVPHIFQLLIISQQTMLFRKGSAVR